jgi:uncharacterized membrane protein
MIVLLTALLAVHLLAATAWVGGMFYTVAVLRPALAALDATPRLQMHLLTLKRFFLVVWHAMPLMLLTGWAMILTSGQGFARLPWNVNVMQGLAIIMAGIFLYTFFGPYRRLRRAIRPGPEILGRIRLMVTINLVLGAIVIAVAPWGQVY